MENTDILPASDEQQEELERRLIEYTNSGAMPADFHPEIQEAMTVGLGNMVSFMETGEVTLASTAAGTVLRIAFALGRELERESLKTQRGEHTGG